MPLKKSQKIERFSDRISDIAIILEVQKLDQRVDVVIKVNQTKIKSQAISEDMYTSIDKAVHKLESQLIRYKDKLQEHQAKGVSTIDMQVNVLRPIPEAELLDINDDIEVENKKRLIDKYTPHKIVSRETTPLKALTDGEALMKMDLSGDAFMIYRAEDTQRIKIIYRRKDNNFGVIQPEA